MLKPAFSSVFPGKQNQRKRLAPLKCKGGLGKWFAGYKALTITKNFYLKTPEICLCTGR
jgi:hypothetical protein